MFESVIKVFVFVYENSIFNIEIFISIIKTQHDYSKCIYNT